MRVGLVGEGSDARRRLKICARNEITCVTSLRTIVVRAV
jgi:hypothetical protein